MALVYIKIVDCLAAAMCVPNYFSRLGLSQSADCDAVIRQSFVAAWTSLHQRIDLGIVQVQEEGEKLLAAYEMLQCASSRECVQSVLQSGKLECRLPPERPLPWTDVLRSEEQRNEQQKQGTWTAACEQQHEAMCDRAGYLWKKRTPPDEATFVAWVRYHCAFNAFTILGVAPDATPEEAQRAFDAHAAPTGMDESQQAKYAQCLQTALELASVPQAEQAEQYRGWLAQGFVDVLQEHIPMRLPATRSNVLGALGMLPASRSTKRNSHSASAQHNKQRATPLQQWLATCATTASVK